MKEITLPLRPCPFCASDKLHSRGMARVKIQCLYCLAEGPDANSAAQAATLWNAEADKAEKTVGLKVLVES